WFMSLPFDTKLHFAAMHLHPFAESIELRDVTANKVLFKANAQNPAKGIGLTHVDTYSNIEGVPMFKNHKYEVTSVYNNTSSENRDSMASIFLSLDDPEFRHFAANEFADRALDAFDATADTIVLLRTSAGDVGISLIAEQERRGLHEVVSMARSGALDHTFLTRSDNHRLDFAAQAALTAEQRTSLTASKKLQSATGLLLLCAGANGGPATIAITLAPTPQPDARCFAFGRIGPGADVIRKLAAAPRRADGKLAMPVEILKAEVMEMSDLQETTLAPAHTLEAPKAAGTTAGSSR
ncbi:MAG TPA: peptidylprolyl isomerase, partial [Thermoanaerobaculia bacterium]|nr:peptidylprolyl isomerase [Thermoanaerobaculia bacterium]